MVKQLFSFYKTNLKLFVQVMASCLIIILLQTLVPIGTRLILNTYIPSGNVDMIIVTSVVLIIATLILALSNYIKVFVGHVLGSQIEWKMRVEMFKHFQSLDFNYFDKYKTGQILSRLTTDLNYISEFAHHGAEETFSASAILLVGLIYLGSINLPFTLICYALIAIHFYILYKKRSVMKKSMRAVRDQLGEVNAKTESSLAAIRLTRAFTNEKMEIEEYIKSNNTYRKFWKTAYGDMAKVMSINSFIIQTQIILVIGIGAIIVYNQKMTVGDLLAFLLFFQILNGAVSRVMNMLEAFQQGVTSMDRYNEVMAVKPAIVDSPNASDIEGVQGDIEFENVNFEYVSDKPVIKNLNLKVKKGTMVALVRVELEKVQSFNCFRVFMT